MAYLKCKRRRFYLGIYEKEEDAAGAYNTCAGIMFGDSAFLNHVDDKAMATRI